ncbi:MAG: hydantoinase/oxoprolinase family protein [Pirellulaceae bacterium]|nr:hydantoinase/oxoprolinase family protein [Pirellulaceae bacterium]
MKWLALDVGGANLKTADGHGFAQSYAFALWREPGRLAQQIRTAISEAPPADHLAVTMTGELADCFETKSAGVKYILNAVGTGSDNRHTRVYLVDGRMVTPQVALSLPQLAAASNWHALARFAGRYASQGPALLVDVGSTTCDVIPLVDGKPIATGTTDTQRLLAGELVYTGVERSPVCAVAASVPYRNQTCPVVHELFATMRDAYLLLDDLAEDLSDHNTADGRPASKGAARTRLGRAIAADSEEFNHRDAVAVARSMADAQAVLLAAAIKRVIARLPGPPAKVVFSGHGEFLAKAALESLGTLPAVISLSKELGLGVSRSASAHALAVLAQEATAR